MSRDIRILRGHVAKDHVHLLVSCPPTLSVAKIVQYLKRRSSRLLQQEFAHVKKRYCVALMIGSCVQDVCYRPVAPCRLHYIVVRRRSDSTSARDAVPD
jgi:REP element-mobilizing transposase RayT